jgi:hypothetical protein
VLPPPPLLLQFAPPVFLPVPRADGSYSHLRGQHGIVVLLSDDGAVVALNSKGQKLWHVSVFLCVPVFLWIMRHET